MSTTSPSAPPAHPEPSGRFYGWRLLGFLWALYFLNMGVPLYGGAVINTWMLRQIAMPRSIFGLGFALESFFLGMLSVAVAGAIHRWGIRVTFSIGFAFLLFGSLWMALVATHPWQYLIGFGFLVGTGASFSTIVPITTTITRWFRRYRGRAMAIAFTASGTAGFITAPLMNKLMATTGGNWRLAWWIVAAIAVVAVALAWLGVREHPEDLGQLPDGSRHEEILANPAAHRHETHWTLGEAARHLSFWMLFVCAIGCHYPFNFFTAHWLLHLTGLGIGSSTAALAMSFFTVGIMGGSLLGGLLADKIPARFACGTGLSFYAIGSFLAMHLSGGSLALAFLTAFLYGMGFGCTFVCLNTVVGNFFGSKSYARINGTIFLLSTIVCTFSAFLGGRIFDVWKSYNPAFALNMAISLAGICALSLAHPPVHEKDAARAAQ